MTENQRGDSITVWDSRGDPPEYPGLVYCWNGFAEEHSVHSLLRYVEAHGERLRHKYLGWVHELGESLIDGKRIIDHLAFEDGLSYWWMTLLVEKSFYKSPITDAVRLLALEEIVLDQKPDTLRLVSADQILHRTLRDLCQNLAVAYKWERVPSPWQLNFRNLYRALPQAVQAIGSLARQLRVRWTLRRTEGANWFGGARSLFFCSYFIHLDQEAGAAGKFHSRQWEGLPKLLHDSGYKTNWIQHYLPSSAAPNAQVAKDWARRFNDHRQEQGFHCFLDAYLSWRIVLRVLKRWLLLMFVSLRLGGFKRAFRPLGSRVSLWPLMRGDWLASMRGSVAVSNLLWIELFDIAVRELPHQNKGLYLCENQAWERALVHAWRKHRHGQLIAVAHSTVRFWDLRYFTDPRTVRSSDSHGMPQADVIALNGKAAVSAYLSVDYPQEAIAECEALRYGYLAGLPTEHVSANATERMRVLILGDYVPSGTIKMLQLLKAAVPHVSEHATYTVKPHPSFMVKPAEYPSLRLKVVIEPLGDMLQNFDIAYSSSMTSTAVDAYLAGLPVVVMLDETALNFSPLRGRPGVRFVSTPAELAAALQTAGNGLATNPDRNDFFFLDPQLPRWKRLLSIASSS